MGVMKRIEIRCSPEDHRKIADAAAQERRSISSFMLHRALGGGVGPAPAVEKTELVETSYPKSEQRQVSPETNFGELLRDLEPPKVQAELDEEKPAGWQRWTTARKQSWVVSQRAAKRNAQQSST